jgi:hypothetical protein
VRGEASIGDLVADALEIGFELLLGLVSNDERRGGRV